ncbi:MAG: PatB family C-S lyase [Zoogloeaceae bacterium]|jgi:cystathionine beta-lyase|nr:PatB family C-S lyase [Zoogloeaceae bacterium]
MRVTLETPDRRGSDSLKWGKYAGQEVLPLWVADMDFAAPPCVIAALQRRLAHGVLGYGVVSKSLEETVVRYLQDAYGWAVRAEWLVWLPGLVTGLNVVCRMSEGGVLTQTPVYPPFLSAPVHSARALTRVPLAFRNNGWQMDFPALEAAMRAAGGNAPKTLLLCHPHNPVGRAWTREELATLADFSVRHDLLVCSDEIHCDLLLEEKRSHLPFARLSEETERRSVTLMAPSKTFNIPGLGCAFAVIPDAALRRRFMGAMAGIVPHVNVLGLVACEAALKEGGAWRETLLSVLRQNRDRLETAVAALPGVSMTRVEATYLAWLDVRALGLAHPVRYFEEHGLGFSDGAEFDAPGWLRCNFGCAPEMLENAISRFARAVKMLRAA